MVTTITGTSSSSASTSLSLSRSLSLALLPDALRLARDHLPGDRELRLRLEGPVRTLAGHSDWTGSQPGFVDHYFW